MSRYLYSGIPGGGGPRAIVPGLLLWARAQQIVGPADTDPVGTLSVFTQGTAAKKPTFKVGIINGKSVLRFDGVDDNLSAGDAIEPATAITVVAVVKSASVATTQIVMGKGLGGGYYQSYSINIVGSKARFNKATNATPNAEANAEVNVALANNTPYIVSGRYDGASLKCRLNGANEATVADASGLFYSSEPLRTGILGNGTDFPLNGDFAEGIIVGSALSDNVLKRLERSLGAFYGITVA